MSLGDPANPVSPKAVWAPIGALIGPVLLVVGQTIVDIFSAGTLVLPEPWDKLAIVVVAIIGALVAAYRAEDPLRLPTLDQVEVAKLPDPVE
jgi:hypothetical protein